MSVKDVKVLLEQFKSFLARKSKMLSGEIELKKLRGLTPEQFANVENQFKLHDADNRSVLSVMYFLIENRHTTRPILHVSSAKCCLYALAVKTEIHDT
jgi:hypothetical protein